MAPLLAVRLVLETPTLYAVVSVWLKLVQIFANSHEVYEFLCETVPAVSRKQFAYTQPLPLAPTVFPPAS